MEASFTATDAGAQRHSPTENFQRHQLSWRSLVSVDSLRDVDDGDGLLEALQDAAVRQIRVTSPVLSLNTSKWRSLTPPVGIERSVVVLGGGRYGGSDSSPITGGAHFVLDCAHLAHKLQLAPSYPSPSTSPTASDNSSTPRLNAVSPSPVALAPVTIEFRGLRMRSHLTAVGYGLLLLHESPGSTVKYTDVIHEQDVAIPLADTATEAATLPQLPGQAQASINFTVAGSWCPPGTVSSTAGAGTIGSPCFSRGAILYGDFAVRVAASWGRNDNSSSQAGSYLVVMHNCTYGVRHEVSGECMAAYGAEFCIAQQRAQLDAASAMGAVTVARKASISAGGGAGIGVGATLGGCLVLMLLYLFVRHLRSGHRTLTMAVKPPGATPLTTLLVTDIQNSTNLWEQLPTAVMNEALRLHHRSLRALLPKCNGYESATEGDSFILAFHTPMDAARFALLAQAALLELPWPAELLEHEEGCEVWAEPSRPKLQRAAAAHHHHHHHHQNKGGLAALLSPSNGGNHHSGIPAYESDSDSDAGVALYESGGHQGHGPAWFAALTVAGRTGMRRRSSIDSPAAPRPGTVTGVPSAASSGVNALFKKEGFSIVRRSFQATRPSISVDRHAHSTTSAAAAAVAAAAASAASSSPLPGAHLLAGSAPRSGAHAPPVASRPLAIARLTALGTTGSPPSSASTTATAAFAAADAAAAAAAAAEAASQQRPPAGPHSKDMQQQPSHLSRLSSAQLMMQAGSFSNCGGGADGVGGLAGLYDMSSGGGGAMVRGDSICGGASAFRDGSAFVEEAAFTAALQAMQDALRGGSSGGGSGRSGSAGRAPPAVAPSGSIGMEPSLRPQAPVVPPCHTGTAGGGSGTTAAASGPYAAKAKQPHVAPGSASARQPAAPDAAWVHSQTEVDAARVGFLTSPATFSSSARMFASGPGSTGDAWLTPGSGGESGGLLATLAQFAIVDMGAGHLPGDTGPPPPPPAPRPPPPPPPPPLLSTPASIPESGFTSGIRSGAGHAVDPAPVVAGSAPAAGQASARLWASSGSEFLSAAGATAQPPGASSGLGARGGLPRNRSFTILNTLQGAATPTVPSRLGPRTALSPGAPHGTSSPVLPPPPPPGHAAQQAQGHLYAGQHLRQEHASGPVTAAAGGAVDGSASGSFVFETSHASAPCPTATPPPSAAASPRPDHSGFGGGDSGPGSHGPFHPAASASASLPNASRRQASHTTPPEREGRASRSRNAVVPSLPAAATASVSSVGSAAGAADAPAYFGGLDGGCLRVPSNAGSDNHHFLNYLHANGSSAEHLHDQTTMELIDKLQASQTKSSEGLMPAPSIAARLRLRIPGELLTEEAETPVTSAGPSLTAPGAGALACASPGVVRHADLWQPLADDAASPAQHSGSKSHTFTGYAPPASRTPSAAAGERGERGANGGRSATHSAYSTAPQQHGGGGHRAAGGSHPLPPALAPRSSSSLRLLAHARTQALEVLPLPERAAEVRETWRDMCRSNWPLAGWGRAGSGLTHSEALPRASLHMSANHHAYHPSHLPPGMPLEPHPETSDCDGGEESNPPHAPLPGHDPAQHPHQRLSPPPHAHMHSNLHDSGGGGGGHSGRVKGRALLFRGFRVRIGLHSGIQLPVDVTFNNTTGHMAYSGMPLKIAKAVGDSAAGGSVLLSNATFAAVHPHMAELPGHPQALYCGDAQIELTVRSLYMLCPRDGVPRLGHLPPLRNVKFVQRGNLDAPVGSVAICFMTVVGATAAAAELGQHAVRALQEFKSLVTRLCCECGGYVVEATEGLCLAAFMEPAAAAVWALRSKQALSAHDWSREVLASPHFKEVLQYAKLRRGRGLPSRRVAQVVARGPRTRTGVAVGPATAEVSTATGRLAYRGKVMNRSARVAAQAKDNQVLLSAAAWQRVVATCGVRTLVAQQESLQRQATGESALSAALPPPSGHSHVPHHGLLVHALYGTGSGSLQAADSANLLSAPASPFRSGAAHALPASAAAAAAASTAAAVAAGGGGLLLTAAEVLLSAAAAAEGDEGMEAALAAAAAAVLPEVPAGHVLAGTSAGTFQLKGVAEPQELFEVRFEAAPPQYASAAAAAAGPRRGGTQSALEPAVLLRSGASTPGNASAAASRVPSLSQALPAVPPSPGSGRRAATTTGVGGAPAAARPPALQPATLPGMVSLAGPLPLALGSPMPPSGVHAAARDVNSGGGPPPAVAAQGGGGAEAEGSDVSREGSVLGCLDAATLAELQAAAAREGVAGDDGEDECDGGAVSGRGGSAGRQRSGQPGTPEGAATPGADGAASPGAGTPRKAAAPLGGDALLEALIAAAMAEGGEDGAGGEGAGAAPACRTSCGQGEASFGQAAVGADVSSDALGTAAAPRSGAGAPAALDQSVGAGPVKAGGLRVSEIEVAGV